MKISERQRSMTQEEVNLKLPRFKYEYAIELSAQLQQMGIQKPFTNEADFSPMISSEERDSEYDTNHSSALRYCTA